MADASTCPSTISNKEQPADRPVYLDCNATTPVDPRVADEVHRFMVSEFGNPGSRTHDYGSRARKAVEKAREQVAAVVDAEPNEVIFTSGATESNNIALLGLADHGKHTGKMHIVSTQIEHKAILDPLTHLSEHGFEITLVPPTRTGWVEPDVVADAVRDDTLLVSVMHANNETGVIQPIADIANRLVDHEVYLHSDAAQGFGKELDQLRNPRIDLISISGHKVYCPKGIGALIARRRKHTRPPITPIVFGGGQEFGLRPGTVAAELVVGLGKAAELAVTEHEDRMAAYTSFKTDLLDAFSNLSPVINGEPHRTLANTINLSFAGIHAEAIMLVVRDSVAISNGSACTSSEYRPSHVLTAMGYTQEEALLATRWSWGPHTLQPNWDRVAEAISILL